MKFSILAVGTIPSLLCILGTVLCNYFSCFFSLPVLITLPWTHTSEVCASFFSLVPCPVYFSYLGFHGLPALSHHFREISELCRLSLFCSTSWTISAVSGGNSRAYFICFWSLRDSCPLMFNILSIVVSYILLILLVVSRGRVNLILVTPSWPEYEILIYLLKI